MEKIINKIELLGGMSTVDENKTSIEQIKNWLHTERLEDTNLWVKFINLFGGKAFNNDIIFPNGKQISVADSKGQIPVSIFLGFTSDEFGIAHIQSLIATNLQEGYIPFAIGDPTGDYWVYNKQNEGIYFWLHDTKYIDDALVKVSDGIEEFILVLEEKKQEKSQGKIVDFWLSDDFKK